MSTSTREQRRATVSDPLALETLVLEQDAGVLFADIATW
jgi:hypothetical protein